MTESTALATTDKPDALAQMFAGLVELAKDPSVQPEKMRAIVDVQKELLHDTREQAFRKAMAAARRDMPKITKTGIITNKDGSKVMSRYATFEAVDAVVRPIAAEYGLDYGFDLQGDPTGKMLVTCEVTHLSEHGAFTVTYGPMPLAIDTTGAKNATQGAGSSASYGKRYTLCAAFNIITEGADDDGRQGVPLAATVAPGKGEDWQERLVDDARGAAINGAEAYAKWFTGRSNMERGYLVDIGEHANCKAAAEAHA